MIRTFLEMGPVGPPILLISVAIIVMVIWRGWQVFGGATPGPATERGINTILFWGAIAAALGYLGMYAGMYRGMDAIAESTIGVNPRLVLKGASEAISSTIAGLAVLIVSAVAWFVLRWRYCAVTGES